MKKWMFCIMIVVGLSTPAFANGNLHTLVVELENIKALVAQQESKATDHGGRWIFRYDVLQQRLDNLIVDINKHIDVINQTPRLERF